MFWINMMNKRFIGLTDTIDVLVGKYETDGSLSSEQVAQLKECADELWGMGNLANEWRDLAYEVLDEIKCNNYETR